MHMLPVSGQGAAVQRGREVSRYRITTAAATVSLRLDTNNGQPLLVEWGDGTSSTCASGATVSRTYTAAYTGYVTVSAFSVATKTTRWESASAGWSFSLAALPKSATYISITGSNTVTGNLSSIPLATYVTITGSNTVTGNLSSIPSATTVNITGSNTVTGNLSSIPSATTVSIGGSNTVTGNLSSIPSATTVYIAGSNTVTGNLSGVPNATYVYIAGSNTVTGNLSGIPKATYVYIAGSNTVTFSGSWTSATMRQVYVRGAVAMDTAAIDALLIALATTVTTWTNEKIININGSRTSASDSAVSTLQGLNVNVIVN